MKIEDRVTQLVEEKIADRPDLFLVSVEMLPVSGVLTILVDGDNGIAIQDCAAISRYVGFQLEEESAIEQAYNLQVSSPGIDTPLKFKRQYEKNVNRTLKIKTSDDATREGKLLEVVDDGILILEDVKPPKVPGEKSKKVISIESFISFEEIKEAKVIISFK
ncbi:MAG: ribosome assembly cofactor RimP [Sphingobacteriales bacterium]|nr:ribosome assembly cofactor RimP [Sphingobacteriales bacterium]